MKRHSPSLRSSELAWAHAGGRQRFPNVHTSSIRHMWAQSADDTVPSKSAPYRYSGIGMRNGVSGLHSAATPPAWKFPQTPLFACLLGYDVQRTGYHPCNQEMLPTSWNARSGELTIPESPQDSRACRRSIPCGEIVGLRGTGGAVYLLDRPGTWRIEHRHRILFRRLRPREPMGSRFSLRTTYEHRHGQRLVRLSGRGISGEHGLG
jgi:hypothetical protein